MTEQPSFRMASFPVRYHSAMRALVLALSFELPRSGRDHARARTLCRSYDDLSLGPALCSGTRPTLPFLFEDHKGFPGWVDETYIKVKKQWMYLYRAVDSRENTLDFMLSATRDGEAAKHFFVKTCTASHTSEPRVINVDKNAAYPKAFNDLKEEGLIPESCELAPA